jgi:hypothetical protein
MGREARQEGGAGWWLAGVWGVDARAERRKGRANWGRKGEKTARERGIRGKPHADPLNPPSCIGIAEFLHDKIKVDGKAGNLGDNITLKREGSSFLLLDCLLFPSLFCPRWLGDVFFTATKLTITSNIPFSKRYIKYLTKKYIQKNVGAGFMRFVFPLLPFLLLSRSLQ